MIYDIIPLLTLISSAIKLTINIIGRLYQVTYSDRKILLNGKMDPEEMNINDDDASESITSNGKKDLEENNDNGN